MCKTKIRDCRSQGATLLEIWMTFFVCLETSLHMKSFFQQLNELPLSLKLTFEIGPKILPFLDAKIELPLDIGRDFKSSVFRKTSHTDSMLNFSAICPYRWKIGLINCMLYRAYNICCNWYSFTKEIEF